MTSRDTTVELRAFTAEDLLVVEPWFDDEETRRRLGDREWPRRLLRLLAPPERVAFVAWVDVRPVALVDIEHAERTSFAVVVEPTLRRRGIATRVLELLLAGELAGRRISVGAEQGNVASARLLARAGFRLAHRDSDGFDIFERP